MSTPTGTATTYDLTVGVKLDMEDAIYLLDPFDVPLLGTYGADGRSALSKGSCFEKYVTWLDETLLTPRSTLSATATTGQTYIAVASGDQKRFATGDVVQVVNAGGLEKLLVTGYGTTADTLLVGTRSYGTVAAGTLTSGKAVVGVGQALTEGTDPENARAIDRNLRTNITQIFGPTAVQVSESENAVAKYGLRGTEFDHQVMNRIREQAVAIEQAILYGEYIDDSSNNKRTMGGFTNYITVNVDSTTTVLTESALLDQLQAVFDYGGSVDRIICGSKQKRVISQFDSTLVRFGRAENTRGQVVDYFTSDFGTCDIILDRWCRTDDLFGISRDQVTVETLTGREMQFEMLAKTGDSRKGQVVCEKTMRFRGDRHAFRFSALT